MKEQIKRWLYTNPRSPITRHPLRISQLLEVDRMLPEVQTGIREQQEEIVRRRERRANRIETA
ncbi:MAG: hypothetical protein C5B45_00540 [Chlamydiae bacterium]|nr:MAG: hypothetical protein C5B45_00540 [Chlamydiota bacterium]